MDYLNGEALKAFKHWFYTHPDYMFMQFDTGNGGMEIDELPDIMTVGLVSEWFTEIKFIHPSLAFGVKKLEKVGHKYNRDYVNSK